MSALKALFDKTVNQCSPVVEDFDRVVNHDEDGVEVITWKKVDYPSIQKKLGSVLDWSLDALLKAGINPNFPIHTGYNTRLEASVYADTLAAYADTLLKETTETTSEN